MLYACDAQWWHHYNPDFYGRKISTDDSCRIPSVEIWKRELNDGLSFAHRTLRTGHWWEEGKVTGGGNSGHQALNLAAQLGFKRIVLLGYDMKRGPNNEIHHHGPHPVPMNNPEADRFPFWRAALASTLPDLKAHGISVINCTRDSDLECFPRVSLEHVL